MKMTPAIFYSAISKFFFAVLLGANFLTNNASVNQCFVCDQTDEVNCDNFDPNNSKFVKDCPPNSKSCSIQKYGDSISRSCEGLELNDCQTANSIEYCYCSKDLCNGDFMHLSDDEDLFEGSGMTKVVSQTPPQNNIPHEGSFSTNLNAYFYNAYIFLLIILVN